MAVDDDLSTNGLIIYSLVQLSPAAAQPLFTIHPVTGDLVTAGTVDVNIDYRLTVVAMVGLFN